jgi:hypothetical protein
MILERTTRKAKDKKRRRTQHDHTFQNVGSKPSAGKRYFNVVTTRGMI